MERADAVKYFWKTFIDKIPNGVLEYISETELEISKLKDVMGNPLYPIDTGDLKSFLFFVDIEPNANWTHKCAYAIISDAKENAWYEHFWPPEESIKLIEV